MPLLEVSFSVRVAGIFRVALVATAYRVRRRQHVAGVDDGLLPCRHGVQEAGLQGRRGISLETPKRSGFKESAIFRSYVFTALLGFLSLTAIAEAAEGPVTIVQRPDLKAVFGQVESRDVVPARARIGGTVHLALG